MVKPHKAMQAIACRTCGEISTFSVAQLEALATRHCKRCGEPLEISKSELQKTMSEAADDDRDESKLGSGSLPPSTKS